MILNIITYPNKLLRTKSKAVSDFDADLWMTLDNMYETMMDKGGVGLAAIQVAIPKRMLIINLPREDRVQYKEDLLEIINPEILESDGEILFQEGCLSVPNFYEMVGRFSYIKLKYCDRFGKEWVLEAEDYLAVALQHEIDHLNGVLFVDKLSILKRKKFEKEYKRLQKEAKEAQKIAQREAKMEKITESRLDSAKNGVDSAIHTEKMSDSALDSADLGDSIDLNESSELSCNTLDLLKSYAPKSKKPYIPQDSHESKISHESHKDSHKISRDSKNPKKSQNKRLYG